MRRRAALALSRATIVAACAIPVALGFPILATTMAGPLVVSVSASPNPFALRAQSPVAHSAALIGIGSGPGDIGLDGAATQANAVGVAGYSASTSGANANGVFGSAKAGAGILGVSAGYSNAGIVGVNSSLSGGVGVEGTGASVGVHGGPALNGVVGSIARGSHPVAGVVGLDINEGGMPILQTTPSAAVAGTSKLATGVLATSTSGVGAYGENSGGGALAPFSVGGLSGTSQLGSGVYGQTDTTSSVPAGVRGYSRIDDGVSGVTGSYGDGAYGIAAVGTIGMFASGQTAISAGGNTLAYESVNVSASGLDAVGLAGISNGVGISTSQVQGTSNGVGVAGLASSKDSIAAYFEDSGGAAAISAGPQVSVEDNVSSATPVQIVAGGTSEAVLDGAGDLTLAGTVDAPAAIRASVRSADGAVRDAYADRATEATVEDVGEGLLIRGRAEIAFDRSLIAIIGGSPYSVFVTPECDAAPPFVAAKTSAGFVVIARDAPVNCAFAYRIVARAASEPLRPRLAFVGVPRSERIAHALLIRSPRAEKKTVFTTSPLRVLPLIRSPHGADLLIRSPKFRLPYLTPSAGGSI